MLLVQHSSVSSRSAVTQRNHLENQKQKQKENEKEKKTLYWFVQENVLLGFFLKVLNN